jgi:hypothetical protein
MFVVSRERPPWAPAVDASASSRSVLVQSRVVIG